MKIRITSDVRPCAAGYPPKVRVEIEGVVFLLTGEQIADLIEELKPYATEDP
jgi:hypothetical protein